MIASVLQHVTQTTVQIMYCKRQMCLNKREKSLKIAENGKMTGGQLNINTHGLTMLIRCTFSAY